jgi:hypothetical protein
VAEVTTPACAADWSGHRVLPARIAHWRGQRLPKQAALASNASADFAQCSETRCTQIFGSGFHKPCSEMRRYPVSGRIPLAGARPLGCPKSPGGEASLTAQIACRSGRYLRLQDNNAVNRCRAGNLLRNGHPGLSDKGLGAAPDTRWKRTVTQENGSHSARTIWPRRLLPQRVRGAIVAPGVIVDSFGCLGGFSWHWDFPWVRLFYGEPLVTDGCVRRLAPAWPQRS